MGCFSTLRESTPADVYDGISQVAAFASREGFSLETLGVAPKAIELIEKHEKLVKEGDAWKVITPYGLVEVICLDP